MPGAWQRPVARVYDYNLNLGENYYSPMKDFVTSERKEENPGPLTFSERIARTGLDNKERKSVTKNVVSFSDTNGHSEPKERRGMQESTKSTSDVKRTELDSSYLDLEHLSSKAVKGAESILKTHRILEEDINEEAPQRLRQKYLHLGGEPCRAANDSIQKRITDIRMSPLRTDRELEHNYRASQDSIAKIYGLERELGSITRQAMSYSSNQKSAKEMAEDAHREEASLSNSSHKSKRVIYESNRKLMNQTKLD